MIKKTNSINDILRNAEKRCKDLAGRSPSWLKDIRREAQQRFEELGLPTAKNEEWKYTNLSPLKETPFTFVEEPSTGKHSVLEDYLHPGDINIVFVNGVYTQELSNITKLPAGIQVLEIDKALEFDPKLKESFAQNLKSHDALEAFNQAYFSNGAYVKIDDKIVSEGLIHIVHLTDLSREHGAFSPRNFIVLGESSEAQVLETYLGFCDQRYFLNTVTEIFLEQNSKLRYCKAQAEGSQAFHIGATRIRQERDSLFDAFSLSTGSKLTRNNLTVFLDGEGAHATINGLYALKGQQHVDNHTAIYHIPPNCTSNQFYKGILTEKSHGVFNGKIFVRKEAQKTNSYQLNKNLLLSEDCHVDTKPQLEISADDVKCTHGATIGQLDEDELFYLQTRAIGKREAIRMLSRGFAEDILNYIQSPSIRQKLDQLLVDFFKFV